MAFVSDAIERKVLFPAIQGFARQVHADGLCTCEGSGDAEAAGVGKGIEHAFRFQSTDAGAIHALIEEESMAVAGSKVQAVAHAIFGDDGGQGQGGITAVQDGGDSFIVLQRQKAGEDAVRRPTGLCGPGFQTGDELTQSLIVFMGDHGVISEPLRPAASA